MPNIVTLPITYVDGQVLTASDLNSNFTTLNTATIPVANGGTALTAGTSGGVLYFSAAGVIGSSGLLTQYGLVYGGGAGAAPVAAAALTNGQLLIGSTGAAPVAASLTAGSGVTITPGAGSISIASSALLNGQCQLQFVSGTSLKLAALNGQSIQIAGVSSSIPSAGVLSGNPTTGSNYVNGVAAQTLSASTVYLVCVFNNAGTLTLDFLTTLTHAPDTTAGNIGVEVATGLTTRTVVGMIRTNATPNFVNSVTQRFVISWFQRRDLALLNGFTANRTTTSATYVELNSEIRCEFLTWADEAVTLAMDAIASGSTADDRYLAISIDASTTPEDAQTFVGSASTISQGLALVKGSLTEGYRFATLLGSIGGGATLTARGAAAPTATPTIRTTLSVGIRG